MLIYFSISAERDTERENWHDRKNRYSERLFRFIQSPDRSKTFHYTAWPLHGSSCVENRADPAFEAHGLKRHTPAARGNRPPFLLADIYSARQSGPINFPDYIEPIVTRSTSIAWIHARERTPKGATPYLNLIFPQSALKALQKDTSFLFFFSRRLFVPSSKLSTTPLLLSSKTQQRFSIHIRYSIFSLVGEEILLGSSFSFFLFQCSLLEGSEVIKETYLESYISNNREFFFFIRFKRGFHD